MTSARRLGADAVQFLGAGTTFSSTVRLSASMKCWNTMPIPLLIASAGRWRSPGRR